MTTPWPPASSVTALLLLPGIAPALVASELSMSGRLVCAAAVAIGWLVPGLIRIDPGRDPARRAPFRKAVRVMPALGMLQMWAGAVPGRGADDEHEQHLDQAIARFIDLPTTSLPGSALLHVCEARGANGIGTLWPMASLAAAPMTVQDRPGTYLPLSHGRMRQAGAAP